MLNVRAATRWPKSDDTTLGMVCSLMQFLRLELFRHGPVGLVHVDAHDDCEDEMLGEKIAHGTPFRRAVEEQLLDCERVVQIGLRGSGYSVDEYKFPLDQV